MAEAAVELTGSRLTGGIVVTLPSQAQAARLPASIKAYGAGHPIPDAYGVRAGEAVERMLEGLTAQDRLLALLSGGGSALLTLPAAGVTLEDMQATTALLLKSGAAIQELNTLRKHLDRLKGGQLARQAAPAQVAALILSDVVGRHAECDRLRADRARPHLLPGLPGYSRELRAGRADPRQRGSHLQAGLQGQRAETPKPGDPLFQQRDQLVIGSNRLAAEAALDTRRPAGLRKPVFIQLD